MELKIGKYLYEITEADRFMDNGRCVQLLTQSKRPSSYGTRPRPVLSKKAVKLISEHDKLRETYSDNGRVHEFSLDLISETQDDNKAY